MRAAFLALAGLLATVGVRADDAAPLAKDPFTRPRLVELAPAAAAPPLLELRAILSAGADSLANVGGRIVRVGEEVSGYRLVGVSEDGALFERDGRSVHVALPERAPPPAPAPGEAALQAQESDDDAS